MVKHETVRIIDTVPSKETWMPSCTLKKSYKDCVSAQNASL